MLKTTILGLGAAAALSLVAAVTPALANYAHCSEEPDAADCRTYNMPGFPPMKGAQPTVSKPIIHAHNHHHPLPQNG